MLLLTSLLDDAGGFPATPGHRYWRVRATANQSGNQSAVVELEMYQGEFGPNQCVGGAASASSTFSANYPAADAFDQSLKDLGNGSGDDLWASANVAPPHWIAYDFGGHKEVNAVGINARQPSFVGQMPSDFEVQWSDDGMAWTTAWAETGISWSAWEYKRFVDPGHTEPSSLRSPHGAHAYWRIWVHRSENGANSPAIGELQFRARPGEGEADQATGGTALASSEFSGSTVAANAFDDNTGTLWSAELSADWGWLRYQFAAPVEVGQVAITVRTDGFADTSPGSFAIQYSDDGVTWTTAWSVEGETGWTLGETRTYTDPNYEYPAATNPTFANVELLLGFEGADGSTAVTDEGSTGHTVNGPFPGGSSGAAIDTAQFRHGTSSLFLTGGSPADHYAITDHAEFTMGSGDFTIETHVRLSGAPAGDQAFLSQWDQTLSNSRRAWALRRNASGQLSFLYSTTGNNEVEVTGAWAPSGDTWYYVAVCRSGSTLRLFVEDPATGIAELVTEHNIGATSINDSVTEMRIGCLNSSGGAQGLVGWLDELRLTVGQGLYTESFVAPQSAFPRS